MADNKKVLPPVITTMRLPAEVLAYATEAAEGRGMSRTQYVIQLILADAKKAGRRFTRQELKPKAEDAAAALYG